MASVLKEEVSFDRSAVTSFDWASYPILTFPETAEPSWGAGEPSAAVVPSAISNAVFDAGIRLRSVPFSPTKVKAALTALGEPDCLGGALR